MLITDFDFFKLLKSMYKESILIRKIDFVITVYFGLNI